MHELTSRIRWLIGKPSIQTGRLTNVVVNRNAEKFEVNNWAISEFVLSCLVPIVGIRPYPLNELMLMVASIARLEPSHVFEWGTHVGKSARIFRETATALGLECEINSVDLPPGSNHIEHPRSQVGKYVRGIDEVILHQGDGLDVSLGIAKSLPSDARLLFFLDGDHEFESVLRELRGILAARPDAIILVHDTFDQSADAGYNLGPYRAVERILEESRFMLHKMTVNTGLPGLTLLYRPAISAALARDA